MFLCLLLVSCPSQVLGLPPTFQRHAFKLIVDGMVCVCMVAYFRVDLVMSRRLVLGVPTLPGGCWDRLETPL